MASDEWPIQDTSIDQILANHVLEHIPPESIGYVFDEVDRVLKPGGQLYAITPHAGSWQAATDPTHHGAGGWTPDIVKYFTGNLENYFPELSWDVESRAILSFPLFLRENLRFSITVSRGDISYELVKVSFVSGEVEFIATVH